MIWGAQDLPPAGRLLRKLFARLLVGTLDYEARLQFKAVDV
jgi:hypothetical protein